MTGTVYCAHNLTVSELVRLPASMSDKTTFFSLGNRILSSFFSAIRVTLLRVKSMLSIRRRERERLMTDISERVGAQWKKV